MGSATVAAAAHRESVRESTATAAAAEDVIHVRRERFIMPTPGKMGGTISSLGRYFTRSDLRL
jgi:hypothetical protein